MKISRVFALSVAALSSIAIGGYAHDAEACGMSVRLDPTPQKATPVQEIARGEKALENGQPLVAARAVLAAFPRIRNAEAGANPLETRALRVFALALVRSEGTVDEKSARVRVAGEWNQQSNLEWAAQALREIDAKRPNDPTVQADLGEALSKLPAQQGDALKILQGLAQKDLMGSPHAYAALARLRSKSGDLAGAEAATKRCEEMSKTPGVCRPAPVPTVPVAKA